ncbi:MAG: hypothetical protein C1943_11485 [Halochromatium sp.]|nr:hypothetical protein [Halochromatium sp.]
MGATIQDHTAQSQALHQRPKCSETGVYGSSQEDQEITILRQQLSACQTQLDLVLGSTSWRILAPLRMTIDVIRADPAYRGALAMLWQRISPARMLRVTRALLAGDPRYRQQLRIVVGRTYARLKKPAGFNAVPLQQRRRPAATNLRLRVVYISGEPGTPGHRYRVVRYADAATMVGAETLLVTVGEAEAQLDTISTAKLLVIWRATWSDTLARVIAAARAAGVRIVFDVDDLMFDPEVASVEVIDGIRTQGLSLNAVREHYARVRKVALAADLCTCPTQNIAAALRELEKPALVLRNGYDAAVYEASYRATIDRHEHPEPSNLVRLGYAAGTRTHQRDFSAAASAIARILRTYPQTRLVLFHGGGGPQSTSATLDLREFEDFTDLQAQIEWRKTVVLEDLPQELARFDINLAPLEVGNPFCEAKSELKFFEAALVGVPTVASPTGPYRSAIQDGVTGFLAESSDEWFDALSLLITDTKRRQVVARNALHAVLWRYGPDSRAQEMQVLLDWACRTGADPLAKRSNVLGRPLEHSIALPLIPEHDVIFLHERLPLASAAVVMPVYNYAHYLAEALDSVKAQTLLDIELVVIDDCSTDHSLAVAQKWLQDNAGRFLRVALLKNHKNAFLGSARNAAIAFAKSPFIMPLDPDNKLLPRCLEACLAALHNSTAAMAYPLIQQMGDTSHLMGTEPWSAERIAHGNYIDAMVMLRKSAWAAAGGYENLHGWEDYDLWCKFVERGLWGLQVPEILALYRVHEQSMLRTLTHRQEIERKLYQEIFRRHPWLDRKSIGLALLSLSKADLAALDATDTNSNLQQSKPNDMDSLHSVFAGAEQRSERLALLINLLRCPITKERLRLSERGDELISESGQTYWPVQDGRPILFQGMHEAAIYPDSHLSNPLCERARKLISETSGLVLNLSAGGSVTRAANVIEAEAALFSNTDLVADAHHLPFQDGCFDLVVAMNAFEHYADPVLAASEIYRVLRPEGKVFIHTAFLQPLHEPPYHFYNCTRYGLARWFAEFEQQDLCVSDNFHPGYALGWLLSEVELMLSAEGSSESAQQFKNAEVGHLLNWWRNPNSREDPLWHELSQLPQPSQERVAAGFEYLGQKPKTRTSATEVA